MDSLSKTSLLCLASTTGRTSSKILTKIQALVSNSHNRWINSTRWSRLPCKRLRSKTYPHKTWRSPLPISMLERRSVLCPAVNRPSKGLKQSKTNSPSKRKIYPRSRKPWRRSRKRLKIWLKPLEKCLIYQQASARKSLKLDCRSKLCMSICRKTLDIALN